MKRFVAGVVVTLLAAFAVLAAIGRLPWNEDPKPSGGGVALAKSDVPPLEFAYLDGTRVSAYLGQAENGLASQEKRAQQIKREVNAALTAGANISLGGSRDEEQSSDATFEINAADRFYAFLRVLRAEHEAVATKRHCNSPQSRTLWLGELDFEEPADRVMEEFECIGVGNFVRVHDVQLFLPPFAQALPRLRSANAFYGALPTPRTPFTSPAQSAALRSALHDYAHRVGKEPRLPFVGAPYGERRKVGGKVALFLPTEYAGITSEPSLLTGSVTVVGKIVYIAPATTRARPAAHRRVKPAPPAYIDYPTVGTFGRALLNSSSVFRADLGVCSKAPTLQTRAQAPLRTALPITGSGRVHKIAERQAFKTTKRQRNVQRKARKRCQSKQGMLDTVKKSVSFKPPLVIVLPLAIYE